MGVKKSKRAKQRTKQLKRRWNGLQGIDSNSEKLPAGYGGIGEILKKRRTAVHKAISNSISLTGVEKDQALRRSNNHEQLKDIVREWVKGDGEQTMADIESGAMNLALERLERRKETMGSDKREGEEDDEEDEGEKDDDEDTLLNMDTDSPANDNNKDDDKDGGPGAGSYSQQTTMAVAFTTTLAIR